MIKKQKIWILLIACVAVVLAVAYVVLANTLFQSPQGPDGEKDLGLFPSMKSEEILRVEVKNAKGSFTVYRGIDKEIYFEGAESQIYDTYLTSSLLASVSGPVATMEVEGYRKDDLSVYGLKEGTEQAVFTVQGSRDPAVSYTVRIGSALVNGAGYYAMVDGTDRLFVLNSYYSTALFSDVKDFFAPRVAIPLVEDEATGSVVLKDFSVYKMDQLLLTIQPSAKEEGEDKLVTETLYAYQMTHPEVNWVSNSEISTVLEGLKDFSGTRVVEFGLNDSVKALQQYLKDETAVAPESQEAKKAFEAMVLFQKYGLLDEEYRFPHVLEYTCQDVTSHVIFGDATEDGVFYVYSADFDLIAEFDAQEYAWMFWEAEDYSVKSLFSHSVYDLSKVEILSPAVNACFEVSVNQEKAQIVSVKDAVSQKEVSVDLFKQMYRGFLYFSNQGEAEKGEATEPSLTVCITVCDGSVWEFVFYDLTDRKSYYTVNGEGGYYVNRDNVKALITYAQNVLEGKSFSSSMF